MKEGATVFLLYERSLILCWILLSVRVHKTLLLDLNILKTLKI